jgi:hypothetical protein
VRGCVEVPLAALELVSEALAHAVFSFAAAQFSPELASTRPSEYMRTPRAFSENPMGVFFDPARVYESFKSGTEFWVLERSIRVGDYAPNSAPSSTGLPAG